MIDKRRIRRTGTTGRPLIARWLLAGMGVVAFASAASAQEAFRGLWAEVFRPGYKSTAEIDAMVAQAAAANYNALLPEVLAYQDANGYDAHGAFWNSAILPHAPAVTDTFDPLAYLCQKAHEFGLEVHPWIIPFRVSTSWPPVGNATLADHPEWFMVQEGYIGGGPTLVDGSYTLDPGSPDVQEYLLSIVRELVENYEIDGINFDRIRYQKTNAGYPAYTWYTRSSLARFQQITGYSGTPASTDSSWCDFRRRTIDEIVRRCRAEIASSKLNPRQPLRFTADVIVFGDAPSTFAGSSAYSLFQNWEYWMAQGWLDAAIPMNYKMEHCPPQNTWYRNWVNKAVVWAHDRHMFIGQANYLNGKSQSVTQMSYALTAGAEGTCSYDYWQTTISSLVCSGFSWINDIAFYTEVRNNLFTSVVPTPMMPWRDPATATEGTLWGQVTDGSTGEPVDNATVQVGTLPAVQTDGNGYFAVTLIPATAEGTIYPILVTKTGLPTGSRPGAVVLAGDLRRCDFPLGSDPVCDVPGDFDGDEDVDMEDFGRFQACLTGSLAGPPPASCVAGLMDDDTDVDRDDLNLWVNCATGAGIPGDPTCNR